MTSQAYQYTNPYGDPCIINGKDSLATFSATLKELTTSAGSITGNVSLAMSASHLRSSGFGVQPGKIQLVFYVHGSSAQSCALNTSNLVAECEQCLLSTPTDGFEYAAVLTGMSVKPTGVEFYNQVDLTLTAVKRLPLRSFEIDLTQGGPYFQFENPGSAASGMRLILTAHTPLSNFQINDIRIKQVSAHDVFIIDGIEGAVTRNGVNAFMGTDLIEFPKVQRGLNQLYVPTPEAISLQAEFYPVFNI
jgi:hypothetical protein